jgi:nicotinate-nucleotide pyrophosphorylase (carboxylating)
MLDNMTPDQAAACVARVRRDGPGVLVEVSGGIDLASAPRYAAAGVDLLSVGALTHSAPILDLGLDLAWEADGAPGSAPPDTQGKG